MGKDQMGYYRDKIQFQSNKISEISLFVQMKYALSKDNLSYKQPKGPIQMKQMLPYSSYMYSTTNGERYKASC